MIIETNLKPFVMLELNLDRIEDERQILKDHGLVFKACLGSYKGKVSPSYLVVITKDSDLNICMNLAKTYNQESILYVTSDRDAGLIYINSDEVESLGKFKRVSKQDAESSDAYTYDLSTNQYYMAV